MNDNSSQPKWKQEFPDFDGMNFELPEGFEDVSLRDDGRPTFVNEALGLTLHVDYVDQAMRQDQDGKRFTLLQEDDDRCGSADPCLAESDEFEPIRVEIEDYRAQMQPSPGPS